MDPVRGLAVPLLLLATMTAARDAVAAPTDRDRLLEGVASVERPGAPGAIVVFGDDAFAVLTGDPDRPEAVVAAARSGKGRVVAFAHDGYVAAERLERREGGGRLLANALRWSGGDTARASVGVVGGDARLVAAVRAAGFDASAITTVAEHGGPDVLLFANPDAFTAVREAAEAHVRRGGGLVAGACPWGWEQVRDRPIRTDLPLNRFLARCGLVFADGTPDPTGGGGFTVDRSRPDAVHAGEALRRIEAGAKDAATGAYLVEKALRSVPPDDTLFLPRAAKAAASVPAADFPRPSRPLTSKDGLARLAVAWRTITWRDLAPEDVPAAPGAEEFPGAPAAAVPRVTTPIRLAPSPPGWRSTGLYLAPGELLTVTTAATTGTDAAPPKWRVRIGCHTDTLWHLDEWKRWPEITHTAPLAAGVTRVATPWGGPVYFEPLAGAEMLEVTVSGAVEAPIYDARDPTRGVAGPSIWARRRGAAAPWAELVGFHLALSVPSSAVREIHDPMELVAWWDRVVQSHCELGGEPVPARPERFVCDVQISAGYMHSGYPIMMHLDVGTPTGRGQRPSDRPAHLVDLERLRREGTWGPLHELGHNRQQPEWTFEGTGEVTCNLFSLYTNEKLAGIPAWDHPWLAGQKANAAHYLKAPDFAKWKADPGVALVTYAQVVREFGWEPVRKVLAECRDLPDAERPRTDAAKIDQFVVRLSRAAGRDLRPHFLRWGWPLSPAAHGDASLANLPRWDSNPDDVKPAGR